MFWSGIQNLQQKKIQHYEQVVNQHYKFERPASFYHYPKRH